jgi:ATP-dependent RNA helicase SUPV3L1/SUV3
MTHKRRRRTSEQRRATKRRQAENKLRSRELLEEFPLRERLHEQREAIVADLIKKGEAALTTQALYVPKTRRRRHHEGDAEQKLGKRTIEAFCVQRKTSLNEAFFAHAAGVRDLTEYFMGVLYTLPETAAYYEGVKSRKAADHTLKQQVADDPNFRDEILESLWEHFTPGTIIALLAENRNHRNVALLFKDKLALRDEMSRDFLNSTPDNYADLFPETRMQKRHFVLHIGPTNSGKTHQSMETLKRAPTGIYLAPLRLLAYEQFERMRDAGVPCSMITGEERILMEDASHQSSTIEMLDSSKEYDIAVIDEGQMCADPQRGGAWTNAILGVRADMVHVCAAENALPCLIRMIRSCNDDYEIIRHERMTPLVIDRDDFDFPQDVQDGDAFIVFSRIDVHGCASDLRENGISCSIIYGALPYDVRHKEAEKFATGQTKVLVATDAIGMGLNLPIRRIVFLQQVKFDGRTKRKLTGTEVKQIAGRAGRYGIYDVGMVQSYSDKEMIADLLNREEPMLRKAVIEIPPAFLDSDARISEILEVWNELPATRDYEKGDIEEKIQLAQELEAIDDQKELIRKFISFSIDAKDENVHDCWIYCYRCLAAGSQANLDELISDADPDRIPTSNERMQALESAYRMYDFLYAYALAFETEEDAERILEKKRRISSQLLDILDDGRFQSKRCKRCGKKLPWIYPYGICDSCFGFGVRSH